MRRACGLPLISVAPPPTLQYFLQHSRRIRVTYETNSKCSDQKRARMVHFRAEFLPDVFLGSWRHCDEMCAGANGIILTKLSLGSQASYAAFSMFAGAFFSVNQTCPAAQVAGHV